MKTYVLHGHHNTLVSEFGTRAQAKARREEILTYKSPREHELRLRLMRILTDAEVSMWRAAQKVSMWRAVQKAHSEAMAPAQKAYYEAVDAAQKAYYEAVEAAQKAYYEAVDAMRKAYGVAVTPVAQKAYSEAVVAAERAYYEASSSSWHRSVCVPDCPWDGRTIFPGGRSI